MDDDRDILEQKRRPRLSDLISPGAPPRAPGTPAHVDAPAGEDEDSCPAFGFLRGGIGDRALAVELRFRSGDSEWFPYSHLAGWRYNRSVGLLLKITSDVTTLVLIRGSNLDAELPGRSVNLTDHGLQRHKITYIREMDEDELRRAGKGEPTIDRIEVAEFDGQEAATEWLKMKAPAFLRK
jgi:hypothetical protein